MTALALVPLVELAEARNPWRARAACRNVPTEVFFSTSSNAVETAMDVCSACPVRVDCAAYAATLEDVVGVWGGRLHTGASLQQRAPISAVPTPAQLPKPDPMPDRVKGEARRIVEAVVTVTGIGPVALFSGLRFADVAAARHLAMWAIRTRLRWSYPQIGRLFDRDHTSAMHGVGRVARRVLWPSTFAEQAQAVAELLDGDLAVTGVSTAQV